MARQVCDPWGGGCVTVSGEENAEARKWYAHNHMPLIAYSSLGRGFFAGKLTSKNRNEVKSLLDEAAVKGYVSDDNFERLSRCELMAQKYGVTVAQIVMAWIFKNDIGSEMEDLEATVCMTSRNISRLIFLYPLSF